MEPLLPLGSIIILENGTKKIMIYGRKQRAVQNQRTYDYVACLYPEGNIDDEYTYLFNHSDIKEIVHEGYRDEDEEKFLEVLNDVNE